MKAKVTAWRLLWNRLPMKDNVGKRLVLNEEEQNCGGCAQDRETVVHAFLECAELARIWNVVVEWIGLCWVSPKSIEDHFISFAGMFNDNGWKRKLGELWICTIWSYGSG